jgi:hypothetical protein
VANSIKLNDRELATVLAGLRALQAGYTTDDSACSKEVLKHHFEHFAEVEPLDGEEIDSLCELLNCAADEPEPSTFWVVLYRHRHGIDVALMWQKEEPTEGQMIETLGDAWEGLGTEADRADESVEARGPYAVRPELYATLPGVRRWDRNGA